MISFAICRKSILGRFLSPPIVLSEGETECEGLRAQESEGVSERVTERRGE
jgi:hypothetical protein